MGATALLQKLPTVLPKKTLQTSIAAAAAGAVFVCIPLRGCVLSAAPGLFAALGLTPLGLTAWLGAVAAGLLNGTDALAYALSGGVLVFGAAWIFREEQQKYPIFAPLVAAASAAGLTLMLCLSDGVLIAIFRSALSGAVSFAVTLAVRTWQREGSARAKLLLLTLAAAGLCAYVPFGFLALLAVFLPSSVLFETVNNEKLSAAADTLCSVEQALVEPTPTDEKTAGAEVFDCAAAEVCAHCTAFSRCWKQSTLAYRALCSAEAAIFSRGHAEPEDFPGEFAATCRLFPQLIGAIDRAMERHTAASQQSRYRRELRDAVAAQYRCLAAFLRQQPPNIENCRYEAQLGARSLAKGKVCGDRTAAVRCGARRYFLLCDGMGTGEDAAGESDFAVSLLRRLLAAGMAPADALAMFNDTAVLRDFGGSAAIDLVCADLATGEATLYKWGGAPSYLLRSQRVEKIGTVSLPPGVRVSSHQQPRRVQLSLKHGEVLILTSDGVSGEDAERLLRRSGRVPPQALADAIAAAGSAQTEDDATAAVLCLRPVHLR